MPADRNAGLTEYALSVAAVSGTLLTAAIFNRFPLIFPDTSAYLDVAFYHVWTLDRSGFYGLALKPFVSFLPVVAALWVGLCAQIALVSALLLAFMRQVWPIDRPISAALLIIAVAALSTLPWHAAQLMPDAFAGPLVLATWMAAWRNMDQNGTPLLWLSVAGMATLHYTFLGIMPAVALATFGVALWFGISVKEIAKRLAALLLCFAVVASAHVTVNGLKFDRWTVAPLGPVFLFARLNEDGLIGPWFEQHCGKDAPEPLCRLRGSIPHDSQVLLWGGNASPFYARINERIGEAASWPWVDDLQQAAIGSIVDQPVEFAKISLAGTADQFIHFTALDDECPSECSLRELGNVHASLRNALDNSRQLRGEIPRKLIRIVTSAISILSLITLPLLLILAVRLKDSRIVSLLLAVAAALIVNAFLTGALSDVHDRYQSRLIWIVPLVIAAVLLRWRWRLNATHPRPSEVRAGDIGRLEAPRP